ncbi:MAG: AlpA family phage regulatory protein [Mesorhizobium sp.]|uniref:helix-turn-helix transcriptional regulator n=1 Tax=unclassified Mesorhizobium TaxID=325217 RepID=UPI000FCC3F2C|nr:MULTISPECIES: AlpA family transcriptional regulator [unclassified Mesorhizobium]RUW41354.1 AlpA family transcriptional regulator [Mesorhizobium sp. M2A.F.Ca.ET.015.02.1.1]RVC97098.1 AlpA family transcriptional regulator [Mesorhizobium sp. M2A.F.Ca.ET.017.03.2.1]RVC99918.1 AlpA family transcriptional regulator [Mesorhizobium sp. M2A.F.Ca.ET.029.05.1.1]RWB37959.1 MAG: AlpA family transcriptional regulator [Mesorhizobium sp.]RWB55279.1 MAG: AlpA family transcriptional regulator [Mesorhizobium 
MADRFISMDEVLDRVSFSKTHIYRKIANGSFPRPVQLGSHKVAFLEREIEDWMIDRLAARDLAVGRAERAERARTIAFGKAGTGIAVSETGAAGERSGR